VAQVHAINTLLNSVKGSKLSKLTVARSLNCLHVIVCVALRCTGELTKDLTLKAKAKDSKFVSEDISRSRTQAKDSEDISRSRTKARNNNTALYSQHDSAAAMTNTTMTIGIVTHITSVSVNQPGF